eukprot:CAMPEP_0119004104 /NCGR_PEP_ID=MMETSP1176-20130426/955_1 /TAXON_ID=265551 /ORGANISM="Synedropsis recta cf, Strain CCMP1620" /LENGTH=182 /DNA_ID=CAMNT_0006955777 /DNA_START=74 /DNA_END=622 /DNA_ORIENTATION=+
MTASSDPPKKFPNMPKNPFLGKASSAIDDCDRPACDDTVSFMNAAKSRLEKNTVPTVAATSSSSTSECPPTSARLGRSSWDLLHSMVAWYPDRPTADDARQMEGFFVTLGRFYPCTWCASDFRENLEAQPIQTKSRDELCVWLCEQHNNVNKKIGKPIFKCDMKTLDERWRKSSKPECSSDH